MTARRAGGAGSYRRTRGGRVECRLSAGPRWARQIFYGYGDTEKHALAAAKARMRLAESGDTDLQGLVAGPLEEWLDWWIDVELADRVADGRLSESTRDSYRSKVDRQIAPHLGKVRVDRLTAPQVRAWLTTLRTAVPPPVGKRTYGPASPRTRQYAHAVLHAALECAVRYDVLDRNVAGKVEPPQVQQARRDEVTEDQARRLLAAAETSRWHALYVVALHVPLRPGELVGLEWPAVILDEQRVALRQPDGRLRAVTAPAGSLLVQHNLVRLDGGWRLHDTKGHAARLVPLAAPAIAALRAHRAAHNAARLAASSWTEVSAQLPDGTSRTLDLVFTTGTGGAIHGAKLGADLKAVCDRAGIPPVTPHGLRHAAKTLLTSGGAPNEVSQQLGGWKTADVADGYTGRLGDAMRDAVDRLAERLA